MAAAIALWPALATAQNAKTSTATNAAVQGDSAMTADPGTMAKPVDVPPATPDRGGARLQPGQTPTFDPPTVQGPAVEVYGPPAPKATKGKIPQIGWTDAPPQVPPALDEAISIVTRNYPSAKSARAALAAAASDVSAAKWLRFPNLTGNVAYLDNNSSPDPQVAVELPVWTGGRIGAGIRRARAAEDATSADYVVTIQSLAQTTSQAYFEVARLAQREQLLADSVREHQRLVGTMERRVEQEVSPLADLELARSRAAQIEQEYTVTRAQRRSTLRILAELIADPNYDLGPIPPYKIVELPNRDSLEEQAIAYDPTIKRLNSLVDLARADFDARKASLFPQLNAQYSYDNVFGSRVGFVLRQQATGGLSQLSQVDASRLRIQGALEDVRVTDQQLRREIANDLIEYDAAKARAQISTGASETASRVSESYMRQFIAGRRSWLDVMNALREAVTAQIGKVDAQVGAMSASVRLLLRSGRWHPVFEQPATVPVSKEN
ncbi:TolC family protein [Novosphingobium sp. PS1R-30]|uniref:TolC family protein n=1 Tax=Novosphingobium anseongense TaxID=3133436 RepID=A0ABU8RVE5_9SPHN